MALFTCKICTAWWNVLQYILWQILSTWMGGFFISVVIVTKTASTSCSAPGSLIALQRICCFGLSQFTSQTPNIHGITAGTPFLIQGTLDSIHTYIHTHTHHTHTHTTHTSHTHTHNSRGKGVSYSISLNISGLQASHGVSAAVNIIKYSQSLSRTYSARGNTTTKSTALWQVAAEVMSSMFSIRSMVRRKSEPR